MLSACKAVCCINLMPLPIVLLLLVVAGLESTLSQSLKLECIRCFSLPIAYLEMQCVSDAFFLFYNK